MAQGGPPGTSSSTRRWTWSRRSRPGRRTLRAGPGRAAVRDGGDRSDRGARHGCRRSRADRLPGPGDRPGTAAFRPDPDDCTTAVRQLHAAGVRTARHAIGDAAVRHVLDVVEGLGPGGRGVHRIEHIETAPDALPPRFAELGVTAVVQPPHTAYTRADGSDEWSRRLGTGQAWRLRDLRDRRPRLGLAGRPLRRTHRPGHGSHTEGRGADGAGGPGGLHDTRGDRGGGVPGHRADLTALGLDPAQAPADEPAEVPVRLTVTGGHVVYRDV